MSTELHILPTAEGNLIVTQFWGGDKRGTCLQLTPETGEGFIQLTAAETESLGRILSEWLAARRMQSTCDL